MAMYKSLFGTGSRLLVDSVEGAHILPSEIRRWRRAGAGDGGRRGGGGVKSRLSLKAEKEVRQDIFKGT